MIRSGCFTLRPNCNIITIKHMKIYYKGAILLREIEVVIDTEEIANYFFQELTKRGYVPTVEELEEIADITFEYLLDKCIIDEEMEE